MSILTKVREIMKDDFILEHNSCISTSAYIITSLFNYSEKKSKKIEDRESFLNLFKKEGIYYLDLLTCEHVILILVEKNRIFLIQSYISIYNCRIDEISFNELGKIWDVEYSCDKPFYEELFHVNNFKNNKYRKDLQGIYLNYFRIH